MQDAWDMLMFGLRLRTPTGYEPRYCITTTPRPLKLIKELIKDPTVFVSTGSTYDNKSNLAEAFYNKIIKRYEGTRIGRQEIHAQILDDNPNALFTREDLDKARVKNREEVPELVRIFVGVDPAVTSGEDSNDTGIVVVGQDDSDHYYVIGDYTCHKKPMGWATQVMKAYCWEEADMVVGEVNNGGDLIETVIRNVPAQPDLNIDIDGQQVPYQSVRATRGKVVRAEPAGAICEQGRLHMVGTWPELEDELVQYDAESSEESPDRYDAMVWAIISMMKEPTPRIRSF
jgi:phage terminase large subunit-like protein